MRNKRKQILQNILLIYYSPRGFQEDTAPKQLTSHNARSLGPDENIWMGACVVTRINHTGIKYLRTIYP